MIRDSSRNNAVGPKCPCYYCSAYLLANRPKDCYNSPDCHSPDYNSKNKQGDGINGKRFPELEKESLFPQTDETGRKLISARKKYEPALTCPHGKKCHGYTYSYNKGHCETCKIFLEAFQLGSGVGEKWINQKIEHLSKNRKVLEAFEATIKPRLKEAAQKPKTKFTAWNLGFWHGALLWLQRLSPED
uniref:Uncharacterized protein n=1 Tax=Lobelia kauaensis TaxID=360856 RepID=A0A1Z2QZ58_9ASTR|nr:hypothetical protein Lo_kau1Pt0117 [Lobelia kauaensis]ASA36750.1 hypothetical protein Lo_kau1Pt0117 [Lobelia kauaensis]